MIGKDPRPGEEHVRRTRNYLRVLLPALREIAERHGYALATHGSLKRDIDLIACPWRDSAGDASSLVETMFHACEVISGYATWPQGWSAQKTFAPPSGSLPNPEKKACGRLVWTIMLSGGPYLDISVMPRGEKR